MADAQRIPVLTRGTLDRVTALAPQFRAVRDTTAALCAPLTADDQMVQSTPEASPTKWHQAHTTWFFETFVLTPHMSGYRPFDPAYRYVFNSYYKQLGEHPFRLTRAFFSRPTLDDVHRYREHVDAAMLRLMDAGIPAEIAALVTLGLHHEQQHQELILTDIKHAFWAQPLRPTYCARPLEAPSAAAPLNWIACNEGIYEIGYADDGFCFDNEKPRHQVYAHSFRLASRLVTNAEYQEFIADGGYRRPELWLSDGWDTVVAQRWDAPLYWELRDGQWLTFTLGGMREVSPHEPVCHISYYEADAYARWAGARLPTEAEWEIAAAGLACDGNLLDRQRFHPAGAASRDRLQQMFGDVWEWTASPYVAYPGFRPAAGALGEYNGKFMCNQMVLRGGSCVTPRSHIRATYRNFFPPQTRWQFSGLRLAQ